MEWRRTIGRLAGVVALLVLAGPALSAERTAPEAVLDGWYGLVLELVRHTPTYSPPVASRSFAYLGVTAYESVASGSDRLRSLTGQLNGFAAVPAREPGAAYDEAVVLDAALADATQNFFSNTGPTGQRALKMVGAEMRAGVVAGLDPAVVARSEAYGRAVADAVLAWSKDDGGAVVENLGFPDHYTLVDKPGHWKPTSLVQLQQAPLLPAWGQNRPFAMPEGASCGLPPPTAYSEEPGSAFRAEVQDVYDTVKGLTPEQRAIARFWSDDPMLSATPPGHWIAITRQTLDREHADVERRAEALTLVGVAVADAFIGCWNVKFQYDYVRPITAIRKLIDPKWDPPLITPPFPEYPSGHSTQSGAAATVLTALFGEDYAFDDASHEDDGLPARHYASFWAAAEEAGISRLYGGIHFRSAVAKGLDQGRCVGAHTVALKTRK